MREIPIRGDTIRLGQLLKLAGIAESGADAKALLSASAGADDAPGAPAILGPPIVNGEPESRRGRQLHPGDVVEVDGERLLVAARGG